MKALIKTLKVLAWLCICGALLGGNPSESQEVYRDGLNTGLVVAGILWGIAYFLDKPNRKLRKEVQEAINEMKAKRQPISH